MTTEIESSMRVVVPPHVLSQEIEQQSAILNTNTEVYFGLDEVGTEMWQALVDAPSIASAVAELMNVFDVDESTLRADVLELVTQLHQHGLIELHA